MSTPAMWFGGGAISADAVSNLERVCQAQLRLLSLLGACGKAGANTPELPLISAELRGRDILLRTGNKSQSAQLQAPFRARNDHLYHLTNQISDITSVLPLFSLLDYAQVRHYRIWTSLEFRKLAY